MFDHVSARYDLLNRLMSLGQDAAWRRAMWRRVPAGAHVVLDLCTGSGASLPGLRRPGRTVVGMDVSLAMLRVADAQHGGRGWAPRFACADAFHLPVREGAIDAITVAFGVRNLRPRRPALAELARALAPRGVLVVLEATAPAPGPLAPFMRFWVRHMIPLLGRLSPDPSAYRYLSESIFEFGAGPEFEADLAAAGFEVVDRQRFLMGATRIWLAQRDGGVGQNRAGLAAALQTARAGSGVIAHPREAGEEMQGEARAWETAQAAISTALTLALAWALSVWVNVHDDLPLSPPQRVVGWVLIVGGIGLFGARAVVQWLRVAASGWGRQTPS